MGQGPWGRVSLLLMTPADPGPPRRVLGPQREASFSAGMEAVGRLARVTSLGVSVSLSAICYLLLGSVANSGLRRLQAHRVGVWERLGRGGSSGACGSGSPSPSPCSCRLRLHRLQLGGGGPAPKPAPHHVGLSVELLAWPPAMAASLCASQETGGAPGPSRPQTEVTCGHAHLRPCVRSQSLCPPHTHGGIGLHPLKQMSKNMWAYFKPPAVLCGLRAPPCPLVSAVGEGDFLPPLWVR